LLLAFTHLAAVDHHVMLVANSIDPNQAKGSPSKCICTSTHITVQCDKESKHTVAGGIRFLAAISKNKPRRRICSHPFNARADTAAMPRQSAPQPCSTPPDPGPCACGPCERPSCTMALRKDEWPGRDS